MDVRIIDELVSVVVDPQIHGLEPSFFKTITGTPTVTSNKYRYNAAETNTFPEFVYGEYEFPLVIPVAPTGGHARSWGLRGKSLGNRGAMVFDISGTTFSVKVYDKDGTVLSRSIDWNAAWTNVEVKFRIGWSATGTTFSIVTGTAANDISVRLVPTGQNFSANLPLGISVSNGVSDNMDLTHVYVVQAGRVRGISSGGSLTGVYNLTPATSATGTSRPLELTSTGSARVEEQLMPTAENNAENTFAFSLRLLASSTYAPSVFKNLGANTTLNIKATAGNLLAAYAYNDNAAIRYLQFHITATTPAGGAVPEESVLLPVAAAGTPGFGRLTADDLTLNGIYGSTGWAFAISTTRNTFTNSATASEHSTFVKYK